MGEYSLARFTAFFRTAHGERSTRISLGGQTLAGVGLRRTINRLRKFPISGIFPERISEPENLSETAPAPFMIKPLLSEFADDAGACCTTWHCRSVRVK